MKTIRPILVTGAHRSGSTWVGRMIATSPRVTYLHEPFNLKHDMGLCRTQFDCWFTYVCERNESAYHRDLRDTIGLRYDLMQKLAEGRRPGHLRASLKRYLKFARDRWFRVRPLMKDPVAVFSAEWLASRFDMDVVVMIRHPAAFVGSLKVKHWTHPFSHFLRQPFLMQEHLQPFEKEIRAFAEEEQDIVDQGALLWKLIHYMISGFKKRHPEWTYLRHEDISRDPVAGFRALFARLDLDFTEAVADAVRRHSFPDQGAAAPRAARGTSDISRDSHANVLTWRERLTAAEIERVRARVSEISSEFYADDEW